MLTPEGQTAVAGWLGEHLGAAQLWVSDGTTSALAALTEAPRVDGAVVLLRAVFGEGEANFTWRRRGVVVDGTVLDAEDGDFGRKSAGAIWTLEVPLELGAA